VCSVRAYIISKLAPHNIRLKM